MKLFFSALVLFFAIAPSVHAHIPLVLEDISQDDITPIDDPELSQAFYGRLEGYPHLFEVRSKEPFTLKVQVLLPDIEGVSEDLSGIVIKETGFRGRVSEVTRMLGRDASWEPFYEPWGGDRYKKGGEFVREVDPGVYRIEVSTPENMTPYVLVVGTREEFGPVGYFEMIGRIADVKEFYGKPRFLVIQSPYVYVPLSVLLVLALIAVYLRTRAHRERVI